MLSIHELHFPVILNLKQKTLICLWISVLLQKSLNKHLLSVFDGSTEVKPSSQVDSGSSVSLSYMPVGEPLTEAFLDLTWCLFREHMTTGLPLAEAPRAVTLWCAAYVTAICTSPKCSPVWSRWRTSAFMRHLLSEHFLSARHCANAKLSHSIFIFTLWCE